MRLPARRWVRAAGCGGMPDRDRRDRGTRPEPHEPPCCGIGAGDGDHGAGGRSDDAARDTPHRGATGGAPRRPHRASEPRSSRRPCLPGARALAANRRAVRAADRRSRRVQGRERHPRTRDWEPGASHDRAAPRIGHPRDGHGRAGGRRRVRRPVARDGQRRRSGCARRASPSSPAAAVQGRRRARRA